MASGDITLAPRHLIRTVSAASITVEIFTSLHASAAFFFDFILCFASPFLL